MKLYEFDEAIIDAFNNAIDEETGEILDNVALSEWNQLTMARDEKVEGTILLEKDLRADALKLKAEEANLAERRKALERRADGIDRFIKNYLNGEKFETERCKVSWRKSTTLEIMDADKIPEDYFRVKVEREPDKTKLKADLKAGVAIDGVVLVENMNMTIK